MVYGSVTQSGGHLSVKSNVNVGTTVLVYLPSTKTQIVEQPRVTACRFRGANGRACPVHRTVLVVDDEDPVRSSVRSFLEQRGLSVADTGDPREAVRLAQELGDDLAMLVTDVIMPEMTGTELARTLMASYPHLAIVFMSGYAAGDNGKSEFPTAKNPPEAVQPADSNRECLCS